MRIPFSKVYRAFPELDRFSDAECRRLVVRARVERAWFQLVWAVAAPARLRHRPNGAQGCSHGWSAARVFAGGAQPVESV